MNIRVRLRNWAARAAAGIALLGGVITLIPATAMAANTTVCNTYCDGRDPALAAGDRQPVSASVFSRTVVLHVSDGDDMAWASIDNGSPTDEVWLDRSFDGGRTWASGSKLGDTTIPPGNTGWRTLMYNVDAPANRGVGALRACGKAGNRPDIACTQWARSTVHAATPAAASATALVQFWNPSTGSWPGWWQGANSLTALIDSATLLNDPTYSYVIGTTYNDNINAQSGNFTNAYIDDTGWWGLAWLKAYDYTGDTRYLRTAQADANYMNTYWDTTCGGGVWWSTAKTYKNAIPNELFLKLNAALHNRISGDTTYLARAQSEWKWFRGTGLINSDNLINDGLLSSCQNNGGTTWTYNQGVILGGLAELYKATGDTSLLSTAEGIANAATSRLTVNGILTEPCEPSSSCNADGVTFKGIFMANLYQLAHSVGTNTYNTFFANQAASIRANDTDPDAQSGQHWAGPFDTPEFARQFSALAALNATL